MFNSSFMVKRFVKLKVLIYLKLAKRKSNLKDSNLLTLNNIVRIFTLLILRTRNGESRT